MPRRGFPSLTSGGRTPSYHTRRNPPSDYPAATVTGGRALPNSLAALSRIRWPTRAEICTIQDLYTALANDTDRNDLILHDINKALECARCPLVLTERTDHLEYLAAKLRRTVQHVIVMRGGMGKRQRAAVVEQINSVSSRENRVILATGRYAGEGFDDARLDTLFLGMPISWRGTLQQYVGRLHRACAGKHEVRVYDYVDRQVPALMRMFAKRLKGYRAMGYVTEDRFELGMNPRQET
jgi:superfamily II DNA or RNA helicase